jgi:hypothetical protein
MQQQQVLLLLLLLLLLGMMRMEWNDTTANEGLMLVGEDGSAVTGYRMQLGAVYCVCTGTGLVLCGSSANCAWQAGTLCSMLVACPDGCRLLLRVEYSTELRVFCMRKTSGYITYWECCIRSARVCLPLPHHACMLQQQMAHVKCVLAPNVTLSVYSMVSLSNALTMPLCMITYVFQANLRGRM